MTTVNINIARMRDRLQDFEFHQLFIGELGWSQPTDARPAEMTVLETSFTRRQIAQLAAVPVFEITTADGAIPDAKTRVAVHKEIVALHYENLLIFVNKERTKSLWYWSKRQNGKTLPRPHHFRPGLRFGRVFGGRDEDVDYDLFERFWHDCFSQRPYAERPCQTDQAGPQEPELHHQKDHHHGQLAGWFSSCSHFRGLSTM